MPCGPRLLPLPQLICCFSSSSPCLQIRRYGAPSKVDERFSAPGRCGYRNACTAALKARRQSLGDSHKFLEELHQVSESVCQFPIWNSSFQSVRPPNVGYLALHADVLAVDRRGARRCSQRYNYTAALSVRLCTLPQPVQLCTAVPLWLMYHIEGLFPSYGTGDSLSYTVRYAALVIIFYKKSHTMFRKSHYMLRKSLYVFQKSLRR